MLLRGALFHRILTEHFHPVGQLVLHRGHILALETGEVHGVEHGFVQALTGVHRTVIAGGIVHRIVINRVDEFPHDTLVRSNLDDRAAGGGWNKAVRPFAGD